MSPNPITMELCGIHIGIPAFWLRASSPAICASPSSFSSPSASASMDRFKRVPSPNEIGGLLGDHHDRRIDVAADEIGHHRRVDYAQALDAFHFQLLVYDVAHAAGSERMM